MWESDCEESWVPKNWCFWTVVLQKTLESPLDCKEILPVHSKWDQSWVFIGRTDAKAETPILWLWCWEGLGAGGDGDDRGWDGWMASPTWWTWVWVNTGSWWWIGRPGALWFMGSQRVRHDWATELNWTELNWIEIQHFISLRYTICISFKTHSRGKCPVRCRGVTWVTGLSPVGAGALVGRRRWELAFWIHKCWKFYRDWLFLVSNIGHYVSNYRGQEHSGSSVVGRNGTLFD